MNRLVQAPYKDGQGDDGGCWAVEWGGGVYPSQPDPEGLINIGCWGSVLWKCQTLKDSKILREGREPWLRGEGGQHDRYLSVCPSVRCFLSTHPALGAGDTLLSREDICGVTEMLEKSPHCYDDQNMWERRPAAGDLWGLARGQTLVSLLSPYEFGPFTRYGPLTK